MLAQPRYSGQMHINCPLLSMSTVSRVYGISNRKDASTGNSALCRTFNTAAQQRVDQLKRPICRTAAVPSINQQLKFKKSVHTSTRQEQQSIAAINDIMGHFKYRKLPKRMLIAVIATNREI